MAQIKINGSNSVDKFNTSDLNKQYPGNTGFNIDTFGGNDSIQLSFIGRSGADAVNAGDGNDAMALFPAYYQGPVHSYALFFGGFGTDTVYIPGGRLGASGFTRKGGLTGFDIYSKASNELVEVSVSDTVEIITIEDSIYLTEDIVNGRIRTVSENEMISRTYGNNADWSVKGLDTYTEYHSPTPTPKSTSTTSSSTSSTSSDSSDWNDIIGNNKKNRLTGTNGDDYIDGGKGNDNINGGKGSDILIGGKGKDTIYTGAGEDMIVMSKKLGKGRKSFDLVMDFTKGEDYLSIEDKNIKKYQFENNKKDDMLYLWYKNDLIGAFAGVDSNNFDWTKADDGTWSVDIL